MRESGVLKSAWLAISRLSLSFVSGVRVALFRVNTGKAYVSGGGSVVFLPDGSAVVPNARPITLGFGMPDGSPVTGSPDLDGWTSVVVTPEMVGLRVAIFTAIETKASSGGHKREEQKKFVQRVITDGGIAGFAKSPEEASLVVNEFLVARGIR